MRVPSGESAGSYAPPANEVILRSSEPSCSSAQICEVPLRSLANTSVVPGPWWTRRAAAVRIAGSLWYSAFPGHAVKSASRCPDTSFMLTQVPFGYRTFAPPADCIITWPVGERFACASRHATTFSIPLSIADEGAAVLNVPIAATAVA